MIPQKTACPNPTGRILTAMLPARSTLGRLPFQARGPAAKSRVPREQLELLLWQFAAQGVQVLWACKPYLWISVMTFFLTFVLGYALAAFGLF